ncbi:MAG: TadG family pilus assembly protein [Desulfobacteraceae bacterium]
MKIKGFWHSEQGAPALLTAILLMVFLGILAFAADFGHRHKVQAELQRATDAGALAGVMAMFPSVGVKDCSGAITTAETYTQKNTVDGDLQELADITAQVGEWGVNPSLENYRTFTALEGEAAEQHANAVQVWASKNLDLWFGPLLGVDNLMVTATATAISGMTGAAYDPEELFPFALYDEIATPDLYGKTEEIYVNTPGVQTPEGEPGILDYGWWTSLDKQISANRPEIQQLLDGEVVREPLYKDDGIRTNNGVINVELYHLEAMLAENGPIEAIVPVVEEHVANPPGAPILRFVKVIIHDANPAGGEGGGSKSITMEFVGEVEPGSNTGIGGSQWSNIDPKRPVLVQ